jgi:pre-rRNA-processing protein IPI1
MADEDAGVRNTLHSFLKFYLMNIPAPAIQPYASTLLLYTTSAMSHIYPDVRLDSIRFLDFLYPALGSQVASGWQNSIASSSTSKASDGSDQEHGERVLRCYLSLLGLALDSRLAIAATPSFVVSSDLSASARLLILKSIRTFFSQDVQEGSGKSKGKEVDQSLTCPTWFFDPAFTSTPELDAFKLLLQSQAEEVHSHDIFDLDETCIAMSDLEESLGKGWTSKQVSDGLYSITQFFKNDFLDNTQKDNPSKSRRYLFQILSPLLLSIFFDAAPTAFAPMNGNASSTAQPLTPSAQLVCVVTSLT